MPNYVDIHSHINFSAYDEDREQVLARMREAGVWTTTVGVDLKTSKEAVSFANKHEGIFATVGLHPNNTDEELFDEDSFALLIKDSKVVAVGECGLDYFRNDPADEAMKERQKAEFIKQIEFAFKHDKPLMLHCRPSRGSMDAYEDVISILKKYPIVHGNVHFFVGDLEIAKQFIALDFTLSFTGVLTFARDYDEVVRSIPLDRILSETDAPYASPEPYRGKRNEPAYVTEVVKKIADIRDESREQVRTALVQNAKKLFKMDV